jgi:hypothetical protein
VCRFRLYLLVHVSAPVAARWLWLLPQAADVVLFTGIVIRASKRESRDG